MAGENKRHQTSLAVWDIPSTVAAGERFTIKAGAKSPAGQSLSGRRIEACDAAGAVVASGELGASPWPGTAALAWTELSLPAPSQPGMISCSVRFKASDLDPPHRDASSRFDIVVVPPPEHTLTIQVVAKETGAPIGEAEIRLGAYRATATAAGRAEMRVAKGRYDLCIWKVGFDAPPRQVTIGNDASLSVEAVTVPEENADRAWRA